MKNMLKRWIAAVLALSLMLVLIPAHAQAADSVAACSTRSNGLPYYIMVNRQCNTVTIYTLDSSGYYTVPCKAMICSTARAGHTTPAGTFQITSVKKRWCYMVDGSYGQYSSQFYGNYLFHSVCYTSPSTDALMTDEYNLLGNVASLGCVRLQVADAKWIYDNCAAGTYVTVYDSDNPGALGKPEKAVAWISPDYDCGWDPTDPVSGNPWRVTVSAGISSYGTGTGSVSGSGTYTKATGATLNAVPAYGSSFSGWYNEAGYLVSSAAAYTFTVTSDTALYARFDSLVTVTGIASRSGSVSGSASIPAGQSVTLRAYSASAAFSGWYNTDGELLSMDSVLTLQPSRDCTCYALFEGDVFADITGTWYTESVMQCYTLGIFSGTTDVTFAPDRTLTRAMAVAVLARMDPSFRFWHAEAALPFTDVSPAAYYASAVGWAYENGIIAGVTESSFCPDAPVTRQQFIAILMRYLIRQPGYEPAAGTVTFSDSDSFSPYARDYIAMAAELGLIYGYPDGCFHPTASLTRAEGAAIMTRVNNLLSS